MNIMMYYVVYVFEGAGLTGLTSSYACCEDATDFAFTT